MSSVIIITGTRKGLGLALAKYYLDGGHTVIGCSRSQTELSHEKYMHFMLDVSDEKAVVKMAREVKRAYGQVDVLINNAGVASMNHIVTTPSGTAASLFNTNFMGTFLFTREFAKQMMRSGGGAIVNFSTVAVPLDLEGEAVYGATKASVESLTRVAAKELASYGIRVNAVGPTPIPTDLIKAIPSNKIEALVEKQAIKRLGTVDDVVNVIDFLISPKSEFISGQTIYLGGVI